MESLPQFRYHPDPLATGSIIVSDTTCRCCHRRRGFIYAGPTYAVEELEESLCPWCISSGAAAAKFDAEFTDRDGVGGYGAWDSVPAEVITEVTQRTPGFSGWQVERWWTHCGDAGEFLGAIGAAELQDRYPEAIASLEEESGYSGEQWTEYMQLLDPQHGPTAYVFRCRHCSALGGYSDCH